MPRNTYKKKQTRTKTNKARQTPSPATQESDKLQLTLGILLLGAAVFMAISFISFLYTGIQDQSEVVSSPISGYRVENWFGIVGAIVAHKFLHNWFGISSFFIPYFSFIVGFTLLAQKPLKMVYQAGSLTLFFTFWISLLMGYISVQANLSDNFLSGTFGYELAIFFRDIIGWGTVVFLILTFAIFSIYNLNMGWAGQLISELLYRIQYSFHSLVERMKNVRISSPKSPGTPPPKFTSAEDKAPATDVEAEQKTTKPEPGVDQEMPFNVEEPFKEPVNPSVSEEQPEIEFNVDETSAEQTSNPAEDEPSFTVTKGKEEAFDDTVQNYDPTLDLSSYHYPEPTLLNENADNNARVTKEELESNKNRIVETLINFKIGISSIKATIGPTVTLYEIVPERGIKISKIKNLEDDIALNLSALGIRIIAPIPGKGTIGIEVPNKNRELVSMHSVVTTQRFMKSDKELPIILGKTVTNELFITDLSKMPHLLIAGATGQGKSVGLNVMITSLLYKRHPSQLKFILVDPKKVELTLFNKIERHFLAKLPNDDEAIITDTKRVIHTLNSLCAEMDNRYDLLKDASCRNIKEYNKKFISRKLNPEKGHRFMPYLVLIIDELADLMMTAGKEIETPIARLAQLARAVGVHLVVATQRPSVNVITGIIKANFPSRLSFKVTSKVDSRTILDSGGADQLVGMGDMLLSHGSDVIRLQCPFIDTAEVENICDFIGSQRGYESAYHLPEYKEDEDTDDQAAIDLKNRDQLFDDAARLIVTHQQGSTSLIQRKMKLGYNRAGRLIDQLEAAGIVGPFEGSKAREVFVSDESSLEQLLTQINEKY